MIKEEKNQRNLAITEISGSDNIPELRFPEFVNEGVWEERFVEEFFSVGSSKRVLQEDWTNKGVPFYRTRELVSLSKNEPFGSEVFISEELFSEISEKYGIPTEGDFLVSGVGTLGICYQVKLNDRFYFKDGNVLWFKLERDINSSYFKFCFQSDYIQNQIEKQTSISTVGTYTIQNAKKTTLWYPPKPAEQQKIASCLSSLDEVIAAHSQKLELLKDHKKGLMQNLFPQEGEKVPKFRFKEFENDGEWVERNESVKILSGVSYKMSEYTPKGVKLVQGANIFNGYYSDTNTIYIDDKTDNQRHIVVKKGDILLGLNRPITNDELKVCLYPFDVGYLYQRAGVLKYKDDIFGDFLYQFLCSPPFLTHLKKELVGSDQPYIKSNLFATNILITPQSFEEQQKIASCLSSLDALITAQAEKIEQLKLHKKGLMQGLFPVKAGHALTE